MHYQNSKNKVFSRYNSAVILVFFVIVVLALSIGCYRYFIELDRYEEQSLLALGEQGNALNNMLEQSVQAITGIQKFANNSLQFPQEMAATVPKLAQDGPLFYLDKPRHEVISLQKNLSGNITGIGNVNYFTRIEREEIAMANALTPAFISAKMIFPQATWFYYVSLNKFVNIYPWIDRDIWHYSDSLLSNEYIINVRPKESMVNEYSWSAPYIDSAGTGLNTSLSLGVYRRKYAVGAVVIDFNLEGLSDTLPEVLSKNNGLVLLNKEQHILVDKKNVTAKLTPDTKLQDVLPRALRYLTTEDFLKLPNSAEVEGWFLQKYELPINGWTLIKYQPYSDFTAPIFNRFILIFSLFLTGFLVFLSLVYILTRKTFIKPATEFMSHIENCAQGDPGKIKPTADWLHWFKIVEDIFGQNRSLLQQLKEQNFILDHRVNEKTQALRKSSEQHQRDFALLNSVMNAIPELIIFNDPDGNLIGCNQSFEKFTGQSKGVMLGENINKYMPSALGTILGELALLSDHDIKQMPNNNKLVLAHQRVIESHHHTYEVFSTQFFNDVGISLGTINIFRDVTEQYRIQSALKNAKDQAEYANKAKSQFLANMSHEIRTPINAMQGMMELLAETVLSSHQSHYLSTAQRASSSLLHLIDELLDLSKIEAGKMFVTKGVANLDLIVDKALKLNVAMAHKNHLNIEVDIAPDVPIEVLTDEMRLVQVLTNLLNNSVKFTHQGFIKLTIDVFAKDDVNTLVRFSVVDSGIGIAKEKQGHLFNAFSQADESMTREYGGSGLGLSICQQIVNLLGGEITLKSDLGKGCELSFILPFALPSHEFNHGGLFNYYGQEKNLTDITLSMDIVLGGLDVNVSEALLNSIKLLGWDYQHLSSIEEVEQISLTKQVILLVNSSTLSTTAFDYFKYITDELQGKLLLLAVCQPTMEKIPVNISDCLSSLPVPYLLVDLPLYRYSINEIAQTLHDNDRVNSALKRVKVEPLLQLVEYASHNLSGLKILLVEDNLVNQLVAKELLCNMQAEVIIAEHGQKAIELLAEIGTKSLVNTGFDLVLMDIQMPVMDGLTATRLIREEPKYADLPIIAMTAHARVEDINNSLSAGMNMHISKPISADFLKKSILSVMHSKCSN